MCGPTKWGEEGLLGGSAGKFLVPPQGYLETDCQTGSGPVSRTAHRLLSLPCPVRVLTDVASLWGTLEHGAAEQKERRAPLYSSRVAYSGWTLTQPTAEPVTLLGLVTACPVPEFIRQHYGAQK